MNRTIGRVIVAGGVVLALAACGANTQGATTDTGAPAASNAAPAGANNQATPAAGDAAPANGANGAPPAGNGTAPGGAQGNGMRRGMPGVMGTIVALNGSTLTVQDQRNQGTTTVDLTSSTQIFKQATVDIGSIKTGTTISAVGTKNGDIFTATQIRTGVTGGIGQGRGQGRGGNSNGGGQPGGNAPAPNGTAQPGGMNGGNGAMRGNRLVGTVEQVANNTLTVKAADGTTTQVQLAANGTVTEQVAGTTPALSANERIAVMGQQNGTNVTAAQINILPAMAQQP